MRDLTERQLDSLWFIAEYIGKRGFAPSVREIAEHMRVASSNAGHEMVVALEKKGMIARERVKSRAIVLTDLGRAQLGQQEPVPEARAKALAAEIRALPAAPASVEWLAEVADRLDSLFTSGETA